jgi:hypothetical protein
MFPDIVLADSSLTVAQWVAQLELALTSCNARELRATIKRAGRSQIAPAPYESIASGYRSMGQAGSNGLRELAKRIPGLARVTSLARR